MRKDPEHKDTMTREDVMEPQGDIITHLSDAVGRMSHVMKA